MTLIITITDPHEVFYGIKTPKKPLLLEVWPTLHTQRSILPYTTHYLGEVEFFLEECSNHKLSEMYNTRVAITSQLRLLVNHKRVFQQ